MGTVSEAVFQTNVSPKNRCVRSDGVLVFSRLHRGSRTGSIFDTATDAVSTRCSPGASLLTPPIARCVRIRVRLRERQSPGYFACTGTIAGTVSLRNQIQSDKLGL